MTTSNRLNHNQAPEDISRSSDYIDSGWTTWRRKRKAVQATSGNEE